MVLLGSGIPRRDVDWAFQTQHFGHCKVNLLSGVVHVITVTNLQKDHLPPAKVKGDPYVFTLHPLHSFKAFTHLHIKRSERPNMP